MSTVRFPYKIEAWVKSHCHLCCYWLKTTEEDRGKTCSEAVREMELPDRRKRETNGKTLDLLNEDMQRVVVMKVDTRDRVRWRQMSHRGHP